MSGHQAFYNKKKQGTVSGTWIVRAFCWNSCDADQTEG